MRRIPWDIVLALLAGFGLGLVYSWLISPTRVIDAVPSALRVDFKDQYRSAIAAAYASTGNLPRAQARLSLLGDTDSLEALNAQAQRMIAGGQSFTEADQLAALASALDQDAVALNTLPVSIPTVALTGENLTTLTATLPTASPDILLQPSETLQSIETQAVLNPPTLRSTRTPVPTLGAPFALIGQEAVCDSNLPDGLLQVVVLNSNRRQMAGVEILIAWDGGEETFFTGLKPELGNGYADYIMNPNTAYTLQLKQGSDIAQGLTTSTCQSSSGETFIGGIKLTFQQP